MVKKLVALLGCLAEKCLKTHSYQASLQWSTRILKEHLTRGYTLNRQRLEQNTRELEAALSLLRKAAAGEVLTTEQGRGVGRGCNL